VQDLQIGPHPGWWTQRLAAQQHPTFEVRERALLLRPLVQGSTTSASAAVSDSTKSLTTRQSSWASRSAMWVWWGAETAMLDANTSRVRTPSSVPNRSSIS
jgi:hypothetical protein